MYQAHHKRDPGNSMSPRDTEDRMPSRIMILAARVWLISFSLIGLMFISGFPTPAHAVCCRCAISQKGVPSVACCKDGELTYAECSAYCAGLGVGAKNSGFNAGVSATCAQNCCFGSQCYTCPSFGPTGACCVGEDCSTRVEASCIIAGGEYKGNGTLCEPATCATAPTGACCVGANCSIETEDSCTNAGGEYKGNDTLCEPATCMATPVPSMSQWGLITMMAAAGLAAVWFLLRRRRTVT
jgi:hypothetical protein